MKTILAALLLASTVFANQASATVINPTANFTLRSITNAGPAYSMDNTWDNAGFEGFLTNVVGVVDRTYLEYSMAGFGGPVANATLNFNLANSRGYIISMGSYAADGISDLAEWSTIQTLFTKFEDLSVAHSVDITALINSSLEGPAFIGFGFSINGSQAFFSRAEAPFINFTAAAVPEPSSLALLGLGLAAAEYSRRRVSALIKPKDP